MAIIVEEKGDIAAFANYQPSEDPSQETTEQPAAPTPAPAAVAPPEPKPAAVPTPTTAPSGTRILASPLARVTAEKEGVGLSLSLIHI